MPEREFVQIARDPFAREDTVRACVMVEPGEVCDWCGRPGRDHKSGGQRLFRYGGWSDSARKPTWTAGLFCSVGCFRSYYS